MSSLSLPRIAPGVRPLFRLTRGSCFVSFLALVAASPAVLASTVTFQSPFTNYEGSSFKAGLAAGDVDGDGHVDLVAVNESGSVADVLHGSGDGTFTDGTPITVGTSQTFIALADLDGDSDLDVVVARSSALSVALGNGNGSFAPAANYTLATAMSAPNRVVRIVDLTGDGRLDLVVNESGQPLSMFAGNGDGTFGPRTTLAVQTSFFVLANVNGDPWLDLLSTTGNELIVRLGTGPATFGAASSYLSPGLVFTRFVTGDWDGDGKIDAATAATNGADRPADVAVFHGNGDGSFVAAARYTVQANPQQILAADLDADGDLDLVTGNLPQSYGGTMSVLRGRGDGTFDASRDHPMGNFVRWPATADFDEDGLIDVAIASRTGASVQVFHSNGDGTLGAIHSTHVGTKPDGVEVGDFDADGLLDAATTYDFGGSFAVALGDGAGNLGTPIARLVPGGVSYLEAGDLDGDGKLDLVTTPPADVADSHVAVWLGNGDGTFQSAATWIAGPNPVRAEIEDFNGDGYADLLTANGGSSVPPDTGRTVALLLGHGDGTFDAPTAIETGLRPYRLETADLDGDGDEDVVVGHSISHWFSVLLGHGDGTFDPPVNYDLGGTTSFVSIGDVDEDGILDLVVQSGDVMTFMGAGDGTFSPSSSLPVGSLRYQVGLEDLDLDGHLDLVIDNGYANAIRVLRGDGHGAFDEPPVGYGIGAAPGYPAFGDFNGDGYPDVVSANHFLDDLAIVLNSTGMPPASVPAGKTAVALGLRVIPQPARGDLFVEFTSTGRAPARIEVFDLSGRRIAARDVAMEAGTRRLKISEGGVLEAGVYFVAVRQAGRTRTARAVVLE